MAMRNWIWRIWAGISRGQAIGNSVDLADVESTIGQQAARHSAPIRLLTICGGLLIAAIAVGTAVMVSHFRERALANSERELENTVLLLARHFDQQLDDLTLVQNGLITYMQSAGITTSDAYGHRMSTHDIHLMLKSKISDVTYVGNLTLLNAAGDVMNWSRSWPVPSVNFSDWGIFQEAQIEP